jgi:aldehyde dehydrogenase (NAD+)
MFDKMACAGLFGHYANAAYHIQGQSSLNTPGMINMTIKQPYGVVAAIIPWNVSLIMFAMKVAAAVAAGNAIIVKTSEKAPLAVREPLYLPRPLLSILSVHQAWRPHQTSWVSSRSD